MNFSVCGFYFQLIKALKLKIQKLNEALLEANEGYRKMAEENSQLKHTIMLKVCQHFTKSNFTMAFIYRCTGCFCVFVQVNTLFSLKGWDAIPRDLDKLKK